MAAIPTLDFPELRQLNLRWPISRSLLRSGNFAGLRVMAIMLWPGDAAKRQEFLATMIAADMGLLESCPPEGPGLFEAWHTTISESLSARFLQHGGHAAVARAPGYDALEKAMKAPQEECRAAGCILIALTALAREPEARRESKCVSLDGSARQPARVAFASKTQKAYHMFVEAIIRGMSNKVVCPL